MRGSVRSLVYILPGAFLRVTISKCSKCLFLNPPVLVLKMHLGKGSVLHTPRKSPSDISDLSLGDDLGQWGTTTRQGKAIPEFAIGGTNTILNLLVSAGLRLATCYLLLSLQARRHGARSSKTVRPSQNLKRGYGKLLPAPHTFIRNQIWKNIKPCTYCRHFILSLSILKAIYLSYLSELFPISSPDLDEGMSIFS